MRSSSTGFASSHGDKVGTIKTRFDATPEIFPAVDEIYVMKQLGSIIAGRADWWNPPAGCSPRVLRTHRIT